MSNLQTRFIMAAVSVLFCILSSNLAFASGTFSPSAVVLGNIDNRYNVGKEYIYGSRSANNASSCSSCHSSFQRGSLISKSNQLASIIQNCKGPHRVYCSGGRSTLSPTMVSSVVYTLKVRYNLGN